PWGYTALAINGDPKGATPFAALTHVTSTVTGIDQLWGNITQITTAPAGVDLLEVADTHYNNDVASWIIKRPNWTQDCSKSYAGTSNLISSCPNNTINYDSYGQVASMTTGDASGDSTLVVTTVITRDQYGNAILVNSDDQSGHHRSLCT